MTEVRVAGPEVPVGDQGDAAVLRVDVQIGVDVGQAVVDVAAGRLVAEPRGQRRKLARGAAQALADAQEALRAARGIEIGNVGDQAQLEVLARHEQQLSAHRVVVELVQVLAGRDVVDHAVALGDLRREAAGDDIAEQRPGDGALRLDEIVVAEGDLRVRLGLERGLRG